MPDRLRDLPADGSRGQKAHGRSASDVGPGPGVIRVGHWFEPNGTAGGRNGFTPRFSDFGDDGGARIATHELVVHQAIVAEEQ